MEVKFRFVEAAPIPTFGVAPMDPLNVVFAAASTGSTQKLPKIA